MSLKLKLNSCEDNSLFFPSTVTAVTLLKEEPRGYGCWFVVIVESLDPLQCTYIDIGLVSCRL